MNQAKKQYLFYCGVCIAVLEGVKHMFALQYGSREANNNLNRTDALGP